MDTDTVIKGEYIVVFKKDAENFECKCLLYQASTCTIISLSLHTFAQLALHATKFCEILLVNILSILFPMPTSDYLQCYSNIVSYHGFLKLP